MKPHLAEPYTPGTFLYHVQVLEQRENTYRLGSSWSLRHGGVENEHRFPAAETLFLEVNL